MIKVKRHLQDQLLRLISEASKKDELTQLAIIDTFIKNNLVIAEYKYNVDREFLKYLDNDMIKSEGTRGLLSVLHTDDVVLSEPHHVEKYWNVYPHSCVLFKLDKIK